MDSAIGAAARALAVGDPLDALKYVALRNDAPALALRGIAMAQLGELVAARSLLRRAERAFGQSDPVAGARCALARAEVALSLRDLNAANRGLAAATQLLTARGDQENALFGSLLEVRRLTMLGDVAGAQAALHALSFDTVSARLTALAGLATADLAMKRLDSATATVALARARDAAKRSQVPQLALEVQRLTRRLESPVARKVTCNIESPLLLRELETLSSQLVIDGCRREIRHGGHVVSLVRRPVLLELALTLGRHSPREVTRETLIVRAFEATHVNDSYRARLRVEVGRLRTLLGRAATIRATHAGYVMTGCEGDGDGHGVTVLLPPTDDETSALWALLQGGESWATSALAEALGKSQRAVQRALGALEREGKVQSVGKGRARRWVATPAASSATALLLVAPGTL